MAVGRELAEVDGDLWAALRMATEPKPSAVILDGRTLRFSQESGERATKGPSASG